MINRFKNSIALLLATFVLISCSNGAKDALLNSEESLKLRSIQTKSFDAKNKKAMLRDIIATMQNLDFVIDKADNQLGAITGTKFASGNPLKLTVTVRARGKKIIVRANAEYGVSAVTDPKTYQDFFVSLEKTMFLSSNKAD